MSQTRQLAAIMFTDIVGYSTLMSKDEEGAVRLLDLSRQLQQKIAEHQGKWIKELGDGVITVFDNVLNAIKCAIDIQDQAKAIGNLSQKSAIHSGEVSTTENDVFGDNIDLTLQIQQLAEEDSILLSGTALSAIINITSIQTSYLGDFTLKNIQLPVSLYAVVGEGLKIPTLGKKKHSSQAPDQEASEITGTDDPFVGRVKDLIEQNMATSELSVAYLCQELGISRPQLYRRVQAETGYAPSDFIREIRLLKASVLLRKKTNNVSEVAYLVGFNNLSYFSKCFQERYALTPSEYRKNYLEEKISTRSLTRLIGRETEIQEILEILRESPLLTLTGTGGTGKTRLALEICKHSHIKDRAGVYFVELAPVKNAEAVIPKIAQTLKIIQDPSKETIDSIIEFVNNQDMLIFLDNFEHVLEATFDIKTLLESCGRLKILVTSRVILNIPGEVEYILSQLSIPSKNETYSIGQLGQFTSIQLFQDRAQSVDPKFKLTEKNCDAIAKICQKLDGLPLAIELAAARLKLFSPEALLRRLTNTLDILRSSSAAHPDRHRTLTSAIDWSYSLLSPVEQTLFRRMSVFSGGCTLEAAEKVCFQGYQEHLDLIDHIASLVDHSLIQRQTQEDGEPRFYLLETMKAFGQARLETSLEIEDVMANYISYFSNVVVEAERHLIGHEQANWLGKIELELDNLRSILSWIEKRGEPELGLKICVAFWRYWTMRTMMREGTEWLRRMLDIPTDNLESEARCRALNAYGIMFGITSGAAYAKPFFEKTIAIARKMHYQEALGEALNHLAWVYQYTNEFKQCEACCQESFVINRTLNDQRAISVAHANLGHALLYQGKMSEAIYNYHLAGSIRKEIGDLRGYAFNLTNEAWVHMHMGEFGQSQQKTNLAENILAKLEDKQLIAWATNIKGYTLFYQQRFEESADLLIKANELWQKSGNIIAHVTCRVMQVNILYAQQENIRAQKLLLETKSDLNEGIAGFNTYSYDYILILCHLSEESLEHHLELAKRNIGDILKKGVMLYLPDFLELTSSLLTGKGLFDNAVQLMALSVRLRKERKIPVPPLRKIYHDSILTKLKSRLEPAKFNLNWDKGGSLTPEDCLTLIA
jgi:predicted ATPase/AraC-like DNA-binding protein/class 3 adenylate cyclase